MSGLDILSRRLGSRARRAAEDARRLTRYTGREHGAYGDESRASRIIRGGPDTIEYPLSYDPFMRARRGRDTWDLHTHVPARHEAAPGRADLDLAMREENIGPHRSVVLSPSTDDAPSVFMTRFDRNPPNRSGALDAIRNSVAAAVRRPRHAESVYDALEATGAIDDEYPAIETWMRRHLPQLLRPLRLAERDVAGGEVFHDVRASPHEPFRPGAELSPAIDDVYRYLRSRGFAGGGVAKRRRMR